MRDWSTALGGEEGQKRDCFGECTSCWVAFEGKTVISPMVQSPGSDCQAVPRNPGSSTQQRANGKIVSPKRFFFKLCEALNSHGLLLEVKMGLEKLKMSPKSS